MLEILIKMNTKSLSSRVYYNDFCAWLGKSTAPTETFYFRHDSKKNPGFEISLQKNSEKRDPFKKNVSEIITRSNLKE